MVDSYYDKNMMTCPMPRRPAFNRDAFIAADECGERVWPSWPDLRGSEWIPGEFDSCDDDSGEAR